MKLTTANLKRICGLNGFTVAELCLVVGRHKTTVYRSLKNPKHFAPTISLVEAALPIRRSPNA